MWTPMLVGEEEEEEGEGKKKRKGQGRDQMIVDQAKDESIRTHDSGHWQGKICIQ